MLLLQDVERRIKEWCQAGRQIRRGNYNKKVGKNFYACYIIHEVISKVIQKEIEKSALMRLKR